MKIELTGIAAMLIEQLANLTHDEQRAFALQIGGALATVAKSTRTTIDDVALRAVGLPFAKAFIEGVEAKL